MKKIGLIIIALLLFGCASENKVKSVRCEYDDTLSKVKQVVELTYSKDDKIEKIKYSKEAEMAQELVDRFGSIEKVEKKFKEQRVNQNNKQKGIKWSIAISKKLKLKEIAKIDFVKVNIKDLSFLNITDKKNSEKIIKNLERTNYICK